MATCPRLRPTVDLARVEANGARLVCLFDRQDPPSGQVVVSEGGLLLASLLDGERSVQAVRAADRGGRYRAADRRVRPTARRGQLARQRAVSGTCAAEYRGVSELSGPARGARWAGVSSRPRRAVRLPGLALHG